MGQLIMDILSTNYIQVSAPIVYSFPQDEDNQIICIRDQVKISWCKKKNASGFIWDPMSCVKQLRKDMLGCSSYWQVHPSLSSDMEYLKKFERVDIISLPFLMT